MSNCQVEEDVGRQENTIQTVSLDEAISFVKQNPLNSSSKTGKKKTFTPDFDAITQEKITNSDQLITVIPLYSNTRQEYSRILLLKIKDTIKSVVFSMYPDKDALSKDFSGKILITKNNGEFVNGFRIKKGYIVSQFVKKKTSTSNSRMQSKIIIIDGVEFEELNEVIVMNNYHSEPSTISYMTLFNDWSGSSGNEINYGTSWEYSSDGGGGSTVADPVAEDPCSQIKGLLNYNSAESNSLKSSIDWLKDKVNAAVNNKEAGVEVKKVMNPDETFKYEFTQVLSNEQFSIPMSVGFGYVGGLHSHPSNGDAMFSFQDIRFLLSVYDEASPSRKHEAFNGLVCKDARGNTNTYMLKIENIELLRTQINSVWDRPDLVGLSEKDRIEVIHQNQAIKYSKSNGNLEKSFLEQFKDFGIELFKADATTNNFDKLTLNNSTVTPTPCN